MKSIIGILVVICCIVMCACSKIGPSTTEHKSFDEYRDVLEALSANGFDGVAEQMKSRGTQSLILTDLADHTLVAMGSSRIGGTPDLPEGTSWPELDGKSLSFIAQIDLREVSVIWPECPLPGSGFLSFFYDAEQSVWGFDPKDKGKWEVRFFDVPSENLHTTGFPSDLPDYARFARRNVKPVLNTDYPDGYQLDLRSHGLSEAEENTVFEILDAFVDGEGKFHKLLGHPNQIQGDMQMECQLVFHGLYCGDSSGYEDPRADALRAGSSDWRLLLQIDSDDDARMMWGDVGRLYYWIRNQDLASETFENSWLILQCY